MAATATGPVSEADRSGIQDLTNEQVVRLGLFLLILPGVVIGVTALFFPKYFYEQFLLGLSWLTRLGPYNEHQIVWLGGLYLALTAATAYLMTRPEPQAVKMICWAQVVGSFPHMCFHVYMWRMSGWFQTLLQAGTLALTWIVALAVIYYNSRRRVATALVPDASGRRSPAADGLVTAGLFLLAVPTVVIGATATFFPRYFYNEFFLGAGWESRMGAYSSHLVIDIGALNSAVAVGTVLALVWRTPEAVRAIGWVVVAGTVPHLVYLLAVQESLTGTAKAVTAGSLAVMVVLALAVLALNNRRRLVSVWVREGDPAPAAAIGVTGRRSAAVASH